MKELMFEKFTEGPSLVNTLWDLSQGLCKEEFLDFIIFVVI